MARIRFAKINDADALAKLHEKCFPNYWDVSAFNNFFAVNGMSALVVENPHLIGMIVYSVAGEQADIITIAVLPEFRRLGIARTLLAPTLENMASSGAKSVFLDVEDGNLAALQLYDKYGFTVINRRKQYYKQKDGSFTDGLVMTRKLA